ncbi:hypothetical protein M514_19312 [Trichuris suis]|uniref:Uncharacterized protein n=1 Tax=Trichuris suis TaxID=68888 RepID=A0A085NG90_9BILA|nr:hypothetical protein M514_19312 [Trichuris suis]
MLASPSIRPTSAWTAAVSSNREPSSLGPPRQSDGGASAQPTEHGGDTTTNVTNTQQQQLAYSLLCRRRVRSVGRSLHRLTDEVDQGSTAHGLS